MSKRMLIVIGVLIVVVVIFIIQGKNPNQSSSSTSTGQCQVKVTAAGGLNVRSSPSTTAAEVGRFQQNQVINADKTVQNGFRQVNANQWVSNQYVQVVSGAC